MQFTKKDLKKMILPLFAEQVLVLVVGMADTFMVSYAGEAAVSGVSLVNNFNNIFIIVFTALASGGAVIISHYLGKGDQQNAGRSASQLLMLSTVISIVIAIAVLIWNENMLRLLFGNVADDVMQACITYLIISAFSYPFLAVYNAGAASFRSMGRTSVTMYISFISNVINLVGNYIGVFVLHAWVAGVAWPTLISRAFTAIAITILGSSRKNTVRYRIKDVFAWDGTLLSRMMRVAIPNSVESAVFQIVKVALSSIVALFGTYQIAANGIAQSIWSLAALCGVAMGPAYITVIGQCMGASQPDQAEYYFKRLTKITLMLSIIWCAFILAITPLLLRFTAISEQARQLTFILVLIHNFFCAFVSPFNCLGNGLRAAGDVRYTMIVSVASTLGARLLFSYIFAVTLNLGVIGIALAMCLDWCVRAVFFIGRVHSGKWKQFRLV